MRYLSCDFAFRSVTHCEWPVPATGPAAAPTLCQLLSSLPGQLRAALRALLLCPPTSHTNCLACLKHLPGSSLPSLRWGNPKLTAKGQCLHKGFGKHGGKPKRALSISVFTELDPNHGGFCVTAKEVKLEWKLEELLFNWETDNIFLCNSDMKDINTVFASLKHNRFS